MAGTECEGKKERQELKLERYTAAKSRNKSIWHLFMLFTTPKLDMLSTKVISL